MKVKINLKHDGIAPLRAHYNDAGADVYTTAGVILKPHETKKIPLGFSIELPDGFMACVFPRSGKSCEGLVCELPPIDSGSRGEVHAIVTNLTDKKTLIPGRTRIGQLVVMPIVLAEFVQDLGEQRGESAFGSTGDGLGEENEAE